tara:strand:+ start:420 stop:599 length:180 start_codon:yes stop_codon:yes gene_type:complete
MRYIQRKDDYGNLETVDEFESRKEAVNMLWEYRRSDTSAFFYISQKPCRDWQESYQEKS